ncbi:MAG: NIPSNAP family protein [Rhodanobacteraceae bacterium]
MNSQTCCPVIELRQYTLHANARETLIELFDREFVETQEACGMRVIGQFRDLDNPDRFVWLRGFADMPRRARALAAFYGGPVWKAHREGANATMVDSDNVLLLHPDSEDAGFDLHDASREPVGAQMPNNELIVATIYAFGAPVDAGFLEFFAREVAPVLCETGAPSASVTKSVARSATITPPLPLYGRGQRVRVLARLVTEYAANTFPALPVREGEHVFVWFAGFADHAAYGRHIAALVNSPRWRESTAPALSRRLLQPPQTLRLAPTARSLLRARAP